MEFDRDFREFVASFIAHDVRFLIVGGYALAAHGLPRATGDLDAWVWVAAPFIGRAELIANERAANRPQDIADVERLTRADDQ